MDVQDDAGLLLAHHVPTAQGPRCPGPGCAWLVGQQPSVVESDEDDLHGRGAVAGLLGQGPGETLLRSESCAERLRAHAWVCAYERGV